MKDKNRALFLFILLCVLSGTVASTVMTYWYAQTRKTFSDRMLETVQIRRAQFISTYSHDRQHGQSDALTDTLKTVTKSYEYRRSGYRICEYIVMERDAELTVFGRQECKDLMMPKDNLSVISKNIPVNMALSGRSGVVVTKMPSGRKILAAYDFADIDNARLALVAQADFAVMSRPKITAAASAAIMALVIILGGGITFYRLQTKSMNELRQTNSKLMILDDIFNTVTQHTAYFDKDLYYVTANKELLEIFNTDIESIRKKRIGELIVPENNNEYIALGEKCLKGEAVRRQKWINIAGSGAHFADVRLSPHYTENGDIAGVVMTTTDRTQEELSRMELVKTAAELKKLTEELEERVRLETEKRITNERLLFEQKKFADMGQMLSAIAHQWRQPINSVGLYVQLVYDSVKDGTIDDETIESFKNDSLMLVQYMSKTIDDFRSFFDPRTNETNFEVVKAILDTISLFEAQLKNHNIGFSVSCKCTRRDFETCNNLDAPPCKYPETLVTGFATEFRQVILNLIQNARDALMDIAGEKRIEISINACGRDIVISVADNGTGIPLYVLDKIFDPYFTTKQEGKGTGIGLYMSRMIIEEHMKGRITASNGEKGALFTISLPRVIRFHEDELL